MYRTLGLIARAALLLPSLFAADADLQSTLPLMPWPAQVSVRNGAVPITSEFTTSVTGEGASDPRVQSAIPRLLARLTRQTGVPFPPQQVLKNDATLNIVVQKADHRPPQKLGDDERYQLTVGDGHIRLLADTPIGVLRGIETLLQLVRQNQISAGEPTATVGFSVPSVTIEDEPRFAWRGLSFDVSRHFMPVTKVKQTLDGLAAVKLNVLHWHLCDDEGFRVESKIYPRLQQFGSDGMFYTQAEVREVIEYAADRGIRVVPEFEMPGHSTAMLAAYPQLGTGKGPFQVVHSHDPEPVWVMDPTKEYTYEFLDGLIGEMSNLFPDEYFHVGGDEVSPKKWMADPNIRAFMQAHHLAKATELQTYFEKRILDIVTKYGKHMEGWDEVLQPDLPKTAIIQSWRGQDSLWKAAAQGYQGILSAGYYLDLMYPASYHYSIDPMKAPYPAPFSRLPKNAPAPGTPTGLTSEQQKLVMGGEATMWEELASVENIDAKLWPRLAAIAERFWSPESTTDTGSMYRRLEITSRWLEWLGLNHRTNLALMRKRLAGPNPQQPLDILATLVEPVKGYSRHAERYGIFTPLNRLVDSIPPESQPAREFRNAVDAYLTARTEQRNSEALNKQLDIWLQALVNVRSTLESQTLLTENIPVAEGAQKLCHTAQEALIFIERGTVAPPAWKDKNSAIVAQYTDKRIGDLLIQIAPAVKKLVNAVKSSAETSIRPN